MTDATISGPTRADGNDQDNQSNQNDQGNEGERGETPGQKTEAGPGTANVAVEDSAKPLPSRRSKRARRRAKARARRREHDDRTEAADEHAPGAEASTGGDRRLDADVDVDPDGQAKDKAGTDTETAVVAPDSDLGPPSDTLDPPATSFEAVLVDETPRDGKNRSLFGDVIDSSIDETEAGDAGFDTWQEAAASLGEGTAPMPGEQLRAPSPIGRRERSAPKRALTSFVDGSFRIGHKAITIWLPVAALIALIYQSVVRFFGS